jgi:hypothetical protein
VKPSVIKSEERGSKTEGPSQNPGTKKILGAIQEATKVYMKGRKFREGERG